MPCSGNTGQEINFDLHKWRVYRLMSCSDPFSFVLYMKVSKSTHWDLNKMADMSGDNILKCIFLTENVCIFIQIFTEICSKKFSWEQAINCLGNGLVLNRTQPIIWTNDDFIYRCNLASLGHKQGKDVFTFTKGSMKFIYIGFHNSYIHIKVFVIIQLTYKEQSILSMNMLICLKDYIIYNHIFNCILDLAWLKLMKLTLEQQYMLSVLHSQYHACWCSGDFRSQGISRHGFDPQHQNIPFPASQELTSTSNTKKICVQEAVFLDMDE